MESELGRFSHFYVAIAHSNSTFHGAWTPSFCEFTWKLSKFQQNEHTPGNQDPLWKSCKLMSCTWSEIASSAMISTLLPFRRYFPNLLCFEQDPSGSMLYPAAHTETPRFRSLFSKRVYTAFCQVFPLYTRLSILTLLQFIMEINWKYLSAESILMEIHTLN